MKKIVMSVFPVALILASCGTLETSVPQTRAFSTTDDARRVQAVQVLQHLRPEILEQIVTEAKTQADPDAFVISKALALKPHMNAQEFGPLNAAETQVCQTDAYKCSLTLIIASGSENVAMDNFTDGQYDGRQDAFRHSYWNAVMTAEIDETWATQFANAHEAGEPNNLPTQMDYHNNQVGRNIGRSYRVGQRAYIEAAIRSAVLQGRTVRVCGNSLRPTSTSAYC